MANKSNKLEGQTHLGTITNVAKINAHVYMCSRINFYRSIESQNFCPISVAIFRPGYINLIFHIQFKSLSHIRFKLEWISQEDNFLSYQSLKKTVLGFILSELTSSVKTTTRTDQVIISITKYCITLIRQAFEMVCRTQFYSDKVLMKKANCCIMLISFNYLILQYILQNRNFQIVQSMNHIVLDTANRSIFITAGFRTRLLLDHMIIVVTEMKVIVNKKS